VASTSEGKFDDVSSCGGLERFLIAACHEPEEIMACEAPVEGFRESLVVLLGAGDAAGDQGSGVEVGEVRAFGWGTEK